MSVIVVVKVAVMKYHDQSSLGRKEYLMHSSIEQYIVQSSVGRNLEARVDTEALEGCC